MLRTRVITGLFLLAVTLVVVFLTTPVVFKAVIALLMLGASREFGRVANLSPTVSLTLTIVQAILLLVLFTNWETASQFSTSLLVAGCVVWFALFARMAAYRAGSVPDSAFRTIGFFASLVTLTTCFLALGLLQERSNGAFVIALLLLLIGGSDTGAYFSGKRFGRHKLAPVISPNKTWEGVYGGVALALVAGWLWVLATPLEVGFTTLVVTAIVTTLVSVGGDLFISMHKRTVKLDDSGNLFPGHGGVLDRYDSLLAGAPFFALVLELMAP